MHLCEKMIITIVIFNMRMQQFEILERMIPLAASLSWTYEQADMIADVVENIGNAISP